MSTDHALADLIPHGTGMCLIERVVEYDRERIHCTTASHAGAANPLREAGRLSSLAIIEYASQAAAIHAALTEAGIAAGRPAYIGLVKSVRLFTSLLSDIPEAMHLKAECIMSQGNGAVYRFQAYGNEPIAEGQLNLVIPG